MIAILAATLGMGIVSALVPVLSIEVYLVALVAAHPDAHWLAVGLVAALGQILGKLLYYYGGRSGRQLSRKVKRRTEGQRKGRWSQRLDRFQELSHTRPAWSAGFLLLSSSVGIPPFAVVAVIAGTGRIRVDLFVATGLLGLSVRLCAVAAAPALIAYL